MALKQNTQYEILTPDGWSDFSSIQQVKKSTGLKIIFESGKSIECTRTHRFKTTRGWQIASALTIRSRILTQTKTPDKILAIIPITESQTYYDVLDTKRHHYITNTVISHNCEFIGSSHTLIAAAKLRALTWKNPLIKTAMGVEVFQKPIPDHVYAIVADVSHGVGIDYSAFSVVDITPPVIPKKVVDENGKDITPPAPPRIPWTQVAKFRNNEIMPAAYPDVIAKTAAYYNQAYILCESNDIGMQILIDLKEDVEVENVLGSALTPKGQRLSQGHTVKHRLGVKMTTGIKRIGCSALKDLIEQDQLIVNDYETITELSTFVRRLKSFEAEEGCHDDLVMGLVLFGWLSSQPYFKEITDTNIRARMAATRLSQFEDDMSPEAILVSDGQTEPVDPLDRSLGYLDYNVTGWGGTF